ncbi:urokinase plasminogen activator surface receptor-like [Hypomesus transpacificus]|uniref:urokinase plasminogen activator surface receptor-like n=1 Tax=Hypomesus transpacificus TaxID=137520 RepID=UPI001F080F0B|nr:urokinase plasminogen activator surface receptor-like [Hypomesus transpacificus]
MHFAVLFVGCALFSTAFTLKCYECVPGADLTCTETQKTCPSSTQCAAMRVTSYAGGSKIVDVTAKSCATPAECLTGSMNFGISRTLLNSKCCTTELCNSQTVPESSSGTPNGKQCFTCNGQDCLTTLDCLGDENSCISTTTEVSGQKVSMKGCASRSFCAGSMSAQLPGISVKLDCCEGHLCNDAQSLAASLLLLVAPLLSVTLFH